MLPEDTPEAARSAAREHLRHGVQQFHDLHRYAGQAIARSLGGDGAIAWDIYLFYDSGAEWDHELPSPAAWAHQLEDDWADPAHQRVGADLTAWLEAEARSIAEGSLRNQE
jgi:hypothetical protein